jgi:general secretion pathway protein D
MTCRGAAPGDNGSGGLIRPGSSLTAPVPTGSNVISTSAISSAISGFTYLISNASYPGGVAAALRLLDTYGNTKVISNPHIAALDNQKATIKVGDRIPINQTNIVPGSTIQSTFQTVAQYIDTGVLVQVTPHINAGGLVTLEVQAEVSNPGAAAPGDAPPINTRSVQTYVSVLSGETMVMGGLIRDGASNSSNGLPLLSRIPYFGGLFGNQDINKDRTELVLFVTPRVVESSFDARGIIDDLRRRMERLETAYPISPATGLPGIPPAPPQFVAPR